MFRVQSILLGWIKLNPTKSWLNWHGKPYVSKYAGFEPFYKKKQPSCSKHVGFSVAHTLRYVDLYWHLLTYGWHMLTCLDHFGHALRLINDITILGNTTRNKNKDVRKTCPYPSPGMQNEWSQEGSQNDPNIMLFHYNPPSHQSTHDMSFSSNRKSLSLLHQFHRNPIEFHSMMIKLPWKSHVHPFSIIFHSFFSHVFPWLLEAVASSAVSPLSMRPAGSSAV